MEAASGEPPAVSLSLLSCALCLPAIGLAADCANLPVKGFRAAIAAVLEVSVASLVLVLAALLEDRTAM